MKNWKVVLGSEKKNCKKKGIEQQGRGREREKKWENTVSTPEEHSRYRLSISNFYGRNAISNMERILPVETVQTLSSSPFSPSLSRSLPHPHHQQSLRKKNSVRKFRFLFLLFQVFFLALSVSLLLSFSLFLSDSYTVGVWILDWFYPYFIFFFFCWEKNRTFSLNFTLKRIFSF